MVVRRGQYTLEDLAEALQRVQRGESAASVARTSSVPLRTLFKKAKDLRENRTLAGKRRGTKPAIPLALEQDLEDWVATMQRVGLPVGPYAILAKANKIYASLNPIPTRSEPLKKLTTGWYRRFLKRHPILAPRVAQKIARVRNSVEGEAVLSLFYTMAKLIIEKRVGPEQVLNVDETSFMPKTTAGKVVAVKGSTNVWTQEAKASFHMTVVAAVSAAGVAIPPLIILPGKRIRKEEIAAISIPDACISGAPKGFINAGLFKLWLDFFDAQLEKHKVKRPVVLVLDNSSTHVDIEDITACCSRGILPVRLPPNSTHLFQPLDVAVFKPFKSVVKADLQAKLLSSADGNVSKKEAIAIACRAYRSALMEHPQNAVNGFKGTGIYPPSLVNMQRRLRAFKSGGAKGTTGQIAWLKRKTEIQEDVRSNILLLPPAPQTPRKKPRVTVDIVGCLVTKEVAAYVDV